VPDRARALGEIRRVLTCGGSLYSSTIGERHLCELADLAPGRWGEIKRRFSFTLESGGAQLAPYFARVTLHRHDDMLVVTEAESIIAYLASLSRQPLPEAVVERVRLRLAADGAIYLTTDAGLFEAE
jgi:hypothetical protein